MVADPRPHVITRWYLQRDVRWCDFDRVSFTVSSIEREPMSVLNFTHQRFTQTNVFMGPTPLRSPFVKRSILRIKDRGASWHDD